MVAVQRERVLPAVPAETTQDRPVDRPVLYRRPVQRKADRRRAKARRPYRLASERLWAWTAERLRRGWSPLPICGRLRLEHPGDETMRCCPETLYRWVYADRTRRERWARCLPRGHRRRRRARGRGVARIRIPGRTPIRERPYEPSDRSRFGEWEADSVIGAGCNLHTEVERRTRFLMARIVPDKTADASVAAQIAMFSALPAGARTGVTHDNGTEFDRHGRLRERLGMATYFADPYSLCQRGGSENRNGAIRRHLPKRTRIDPSMAADVQAIVDETDNRPMRVLGYRTPAEAFTDELLELTNEQGRCTSK
ncbi:IS30 family transposase [Bifidobacterium breve]|uniref:IS30 family transposase n=1 Tax=Bifidobacterium breve TaxID=1685 RepID=UPI0039FBAA5F